MDRLSDLVRFYDHLGSLEVRLAVEDSPGPESLRGLIERKSIALLSNFARDPLDPPSDGWLGHHSDRQRVCRSGLWNNNHVQEKHDPSFLVSLERLIDKYRT